ncbi:unnamed protein product [Lactuca saligna]|uniref:Uncharacterized protein n=1 Tax=Lactuca saligna TaxID=75948 RepID=A0AA35VTN7_LACSI|nr:unnamed protein product [Lactuca saligna]
MNSKLYSFVTSRGVCNVDLVSTGPIIDFLRLPAWYTIKLHNLNDKRILLKYFCHLDLEIRLGSFRPISLSNYMKFPRWALDAPLLYLWVMLPFNRLFLAVEVNLKVPKGMKLASEKMLVKVGEMYTDFSLHHRDAMAKVTLMENKKAIV